MISIFLRDVQNLQVKVVMKEVANTQYIACMNPTAGSFHITPRMQRHFVTLAVHMPCNDTIKCHDMLPILGAKRIYIESESKTKTTMAPSKRVKSMTGLDMAHSRRDVVRVLMDFCHNAGLTEMWCRTDQVQGAQNVVYIL